MTGSLTWMVLAGAVAGGATALFVSGWNPPRPALAEVLDRLSRPPALPVPARRRLDLAAAAPLSRLGLPRTRTRTDLAILDQDPAEYLAQQTVIAVAGMLILGLLPVLWGLGGQLPLWLALLGAGLALRATHTRSHAAADALRGAVRHGRRLCRRSPTIRGGSAVGAPRAGPPGPAGRMPAGGAAQSARPALDGSFDSAVDDVA